MEREAELPVRFLTLVSCTKFVGWKELITSFFSSGLSAFGHQTALPGEDNYLNLRHFWRVWGGQRGSHWGKKPRKRVGECGPQYDVFKKYRESVSAASSGFDWAVSRVLQLLNVCELQPNMTVWVLNPWHLEPLLESALIPSRKSLYFPISFTHFPHLRNSWMDARLI